MIIGLLLNNNRYNYTRLLLCCVILGCTFGFIYNNIKNSKIDKTNNTEIITQHNDVELTNSIKIDILNQKIIKRYSPKSIIDTISEISKIVLPHGTIVQRKVKIRLSPYSGYT